MSEEILSTARLDATGQIGAPDMAQHPGLDLDDFVENHYGRVVAAVGMITGNRDDALDAVQDALVGLIARPPAYEIRNLPSFVTVIAVNRVRDRYRTKAAESRALRKVGVSTEVVTDAIDMLDLDLARALQALPERQRTICALHYLVDQSVETIAQALGISVGTVKTQLFRARKALAAALTEEAAA